jgi:predicted RND superfamily exporter protein
LLLILFLASSSYFDPVVFIVVIAVSVVLNAGSNLILGAVSHLTNSVAVLLQVAISMDYAIFFLHAFKDERKKGLSAEESVKNAFCKAFRPVSASSLTTIASFAAMLFMRYTIGFDIGLVLGKGIILSLITVFFFMPCFVLLTHKAIEKGEHEGFLTMIKKLFKRKSQNSTPVLKPTFKEGVAKLIVKARLVVPIVFALLIVPAFFAQSNNNFMYGELASSGGEGSVLQTDREAIVAAFGSQNTAVVLFKNEFADKESALSIKLQALENVKSVQSYAIVLSLGGEEAANLSKGNFVGDRFRRIIITLDTDEESDEAFALASKIRKTVGEEFADEEGNENYYILGGTLSTQELKKINIDDFNLVSILTLVFIMVILLVTFRGLILPLILGVVIQSSIWFGMAVPFLLSEPLVFLGYLVVSCVQMGATIDYGILLSSHYTENRKTMDKFEAAKRAFMSSIGPVTTSASILAMVGFSVAISGLTAVTSALGMLLGRGTVISYFMMMFVLPEILLLLDKPIKLTTLKRFEKRRVFDKIDNNSKSL